MAYVMVSVRREDIVDGEPEEACGCPVALAMRRELGFWVRVHGCVVEAEILEPFFITTSLSVEKFINRFDRLAPKLTPAKRRQMFKPFRFRAEIPDGVLPEG